VYAELKLGSPVNGRSVLVVEDDPNSQKLVRELLELHGCTVHTARTADDAVAVADTHQPDLVLMDIQLPGDSGVIALNKLRANPRTSGIPVVALTAFAMRGDRERFLDEGFAGYLSKPIDVRTFIASIKVYLPPQL
jgi:two-component system cell cycle response regulator DivK